MEQNKYGWSNSVAVVQSDCWPCNENPNCVESQEWTYGIDNTGTYFDRPNAEYEITLSDWSTLNWTQTTASNVWRTAQLTEWSDSIQAAADAAWLAWYVEPRAVNNVIPTDISGNYWGTPTWLPWAPSVPVALALIDWGMWARYVNIQICPAQPVPISAKVISHDDSPSQGWTYDGNGRADMQLTTAWAVLWPIQKFIVCRCCGEEPVRYLEDWVTLASAWQIPNCYEPCGTLSLLDSPPDRACEFFYNIACDNVNDPDDTNWINLVTRRATVCWWEQIAVDYFVEDPSDPSALISYDLVWDFVDCDTWEPIVLPPVDWVIIDCDWTIQAETYDTDVRIVWAKNPIPVYQVAQCWEYIRTEDVKLCEVDAEFLLLIDSTGSFAKYSFFTESRTNVSTLSVSSAWGSADYDNYLLYNFVAPDQITTIDVNTDTQLANVTVVDWIIKPWVTTNPKTFSAASFRVADWYLYAQDTAWADAWLYKVNVTTWVVDFVANITWVSWTGTSIAIDNTTDTLIVNWSNLSYTVDWTTWVGTLRGNPPVQPNGSTFDADGNFYVTNASNTYSLTAWLDPLVWDNYKLIIDDWTPWANSLAYYRVIAPQPTCFFRRYWILENGDREIIGDFNVTDDSPRTIVWEVDCCDGWCWDCWDWSTDINIPTTTVTNWNESSSYTTDIEALPVAFPEGYFPPVHIQWEETTYYAGNGVYNWPNWGNYWTQGNTDWADVTKVWFPESAVVPVEWDVGITLPTVSIVDYNGNTNNWGYGQDEDPQALADGWYTKDIEAMPIAVPAWESIPVKIGLSQNTYYNWTNTSSEWASLRVSLNESAVVRVEEINKTPSIISVVDFDQNDSQSIDDDQALLAANGYTQDVEAQSVATLPWVYLWVAHKSHNQPYYAGNGNTGTTPVHMRVALPESQVLRTEEQKAVVTPWGLSIQGVAVTTPPVTTVWSITLTKESWNFVEVSFDGGTSYPLRINRNGTRTWANDSDNLDVSLMRFRWGNANTDYDLIWENL